MTEKTRPPPPGGYAYVVTPNHCTITKMDVYSRTEKRVTAAQKSGWSATGWIPSKHLNRKPGRNVQHSPRWVFDTFEEAKDFLIEETQSARDNAAAKLVHLQDPEYLDKVILAKQRRISADIARLQAVLEGVPAQLVTETNEKIRGATRRLENSKGNMETADAYREPDRTSFIY